MTSLRVVRAFWETHVNNEYYTEAARGSAAYFADIVAKRYRYHYHLLELFKRLEREGMADKTLLEVGCGIGIDTFSLARLGFREVVGIDLTEAAINVARRRAAAEGLGSVRFELGNAERLPFPADAFDVVYSFGVIHHTPCIANAISEMHRVLKPEGRAFVMIYHRHSLVRLIHHLFSLPYEAPQHRGDDCPIVHAYSRSRARLLFDAFSEVRLHTDYPFTFGMRHLSRFVPIFAQRALGRAIGWHLMIEARKSTSSLDPLIP